VPLLVSLTRKRVIYLALNWIEVGLKQWSGPLEWHSLSEHEWGCLANSPGTPQNSSKDSHNFRLADNSLGRPLGLPGRSSVDVSIA